MYDIHLEISSIFISYHNVNSEFVYFLEAAIIYTTNIWTTDELDPL